MATAKRARKTETRTRRLTSTAETAASFESVAEELSTRIRDVHMPYGTIMDPIFASPESDTIVSYTRTGDSAIWTGHFLAAESFRYRVTGSLVALENVKAAIAGIRRLVDITGSDILARVAVPADSPYAADIQREEGGHGVFAQRIENRDFFWIGNTTRDQYSGVIFGLGVALDVVDDPSVQQEVVQLTRRLVGYLVSHFWTVRMPNGRISTVFLQRPDQQLAFLQVGKKAASNEFGSKYRAMALTLSGLTSVPIIYDGLDDHHSYFKFNLNTINMYTLLRFESSRSAFYKPYIGAYDRLRRITASHQNAHFNMIDHAIKGANKRRDDETVSLLSAWLERPRRDPFVDLRGQVRECGDDRACDVIPVPQRPTTDFLWQRSPFLLFGGGVGLVEGPGVDFTLPYWMARFLDVV